MAVAVYGRTSSVNRSRRCAAPSLCTQNRIMNAFVAHNDELEKLLENLSGDIAGLRDNFRGVGGRVYLAPRHKLPRHQRPRQSAASANRRKINIWNQH